MFYCPQIDIPSYEERIMYMAKIVHNKSRLKYYGDETKGLKYVVDVEGIFRNWIHGEENDKSICEQMTKVYRTELNEIFSSV